MLLVEEENILTLQAEIKIVSKKYKQGMKSNGGGKSETTTTIKKTVNQKDKQAKKKAEILDGWSRNPKRGIFARLSTGATSTGTGADQIPSASAKGTDAYKNPQNVS